MMTTFERRQRILAILSERENISVKELVSELDVSEGTIRNDLNALDQEKRLIRVRGGATVKQNTSLPNLQEDAVVARARLNSSAKQRIARRAATLVEDGDSILLDSSTTVYHLAPFLQEKQNLTVVTNGIEVARVLATNPSHTIILIGGILQADTASVGGNLGGKFLKELNIKTAFLSCSGFSIDSGLTEHSLHEASIKIDMIKASQDVIVLVDSTKFGHSALIPFAKISDIDQVFSDDSLDSDYVSQLGKTNLKLTLCGETTATSYTTRDREKQLYRIGFANLSENIPFAVDVRRGLEKSAQERGNIDLILADNSLTPATALHVADRMLLKNIDLFIEYQIDEKTGNLIMNKFQQAGIPVIAVDIPIVGATYFGADNYQTGRTAGVALGEWIRDHWDSTVDKLILLEETRAGALPAARMQGQLDGVQGIIGTLPSSDIIYVSSGATTETAEVQMNKQFKSLSRETKIAILSFNDDVGVGALKAARKNGIESKIVIVGQGADRLARPEIRQPASRFIGSTTFMPEKYGEKLIEIALKILRGKAVPPATYIEHFFVNAENIDFFYSD